MWTHYIFVVFYNMFRLIKPSSGCYTCMYLSASIPILASVYILEYWFLVIYNSVIYSHGMVKIKY
jgi:hypothetical protein